MPGEKLTFRNAYNLIILFTLSTGVVLGIPVELKQDGWAALLIAAAFLLPVLLIYARVLALMPDRDLFEIFEEVFGTAAGRILSFLTAIYAILAGAFALRVFTMFIHMTSFDKTPIIVVTIFITFICMYLAKSDLSVFGRWNGVIFVAFILTFTFLVLSALGTIDLNNLLPVMEHESSRVLEGGFKLMSFPLGEIVIVLTVAGTLPKEKSPYRLFLTGLSLTVLFLLVLFIRNLAVLGSESLDTVYFPTYRAASIVKSGSFFERVESLMSFIYILFGATKIACCLIGASKGMAKAFRCASRKDIALPISLFTAALSSVLFKSMMEMFELLDTYRSIGLIFQLVLPLFVWIAVEIKTKGGRKKTSSPEPGAESGQI